MKAQYETLINPPFTSWGLRHHFNCLVSILSRNVFLVVKQVRQRYDDVLIQNGFSAYCVTCERSLNYSLVHCSDKKNASVRQVKATAYSKDELLENVCF